MLTKAYPAGTPLALVTDFVVWNGAEWVGPDIIMKVQDG